MVHSPGLQSASTPVISTNNLPTTVEGGKAREAYRFALTKLSAKRQVFIHEYLKDLDADRAARLSGHLKRGSGSKLLNDPSISNVLMLAFAWHEHRCIVTKDMIVYELKKIGFANMQNYVRLTSAGEPYVDLSDLTEEQFAAIAEVVIEDFVDGRGDDARDVKRVRFKLHDKKAALDSLGKHLGMFVDKTEHSGAGGGPLVVKIERF